ncbi:unnamed protein product [Thlaspi arvense]|uniref:Pectin acetylesterase n=1 Tax=Thlaspi arvense TaxID=13288 RepID=A0AAU9RLL1_THLAR|nr:unnamed protein product [Thlaspi arvense]
MWISLKILLSGLCGPLSFSYLRKKVKSNFSANEETQPIDSLPSSPSDSATEILCGFAGIKSIPRAMSAPIAIKPLSNFRLCCISRSSRNWLCCAGGGDEERIVMDHGGCMLARLCLGGGSERIQRWIWKTKRYRDGDIVSGKRIDSIKGFHGASHLDFKGAVCLDGTLPGYHLDRGFGSGANSWLIHLEGGGWCNSHSSCVYRKTTRRGSSLRCHVFPAYGTVQKIAILRRMQKKHWTDTAYMTVMDKSNTTNNKRKEPGSPTKSPKPKRTLPTRSPAWDVFTKLKDNELKCSCNYCGKTYSCNPATCGTTNLNTHMKKCKAYLDHLESDSQKVLASSDFNPPETTDVHTSK